MPPKGAVQAPGGSPGAGPDGLSELRRPDAGAGEGDRREEGRGISARTDTPVTRTQISGRLYYVNLLLPICIKKSLASITY